MLSCNSVYESDNFGNDFKIESMLVTFYDNQVYFVFGSTNGVS